MTRVGCLPYSQHARAAMKVDGSGAVSYSDWWGYEVTMVQLLADMYNFRWIVRNYLKCFRLLTVILLSKVSDH